jgi:hypothetical protein
LKPLLGLLPTRGQVSSVRSLFADWTVLSWASLPVTDRRWTAPLSATAVGMGLFIGVAMGPGIGATVGAAQQVIEMPATADTGGGEGTGGGDAGPPALQSPVGNTPAPPASPPPAPTPSTTPPVVAAPPPPATTPAETTPTTTTPDDTEETPPPDDTEEELVFKGTVMHVNESAGSFVLTTAKGQMNAIHAKKLPKPGTKLEVPVRELANGTYAEDGKEKRSGSAKKVKFEGLVTYSDPTSGAYTVSRKGASVLVHADPATEPPPAPPEVGAQVTVSGEIGPPPVEPPPPTTETPPVTEPPPTTPEPPPPTTPSAGRAAPTTGCGVAPEAPEAAATIVTGVSFTVDIEFLGYSDFEGIVQGVCADSGELILSADDLRESAADLTLPVEPEAGLDLAVVEPGDVVDASAVIDQETGDLSLTGISSDAGIKGADDADLTQGDQAG